MRDVATVILEEERPEQKGLHSMVGYATDCAQ